MPAKLSTDQHDYDKDSKTSFNFTLNLVIDSLLLRRVYSEEEKTKGFGGCMDMEPIFGFNTEDSVFNF